MADCQLPRLISLTAPIVIVGSQQSTSYVTRNGQLSSRTTPPTGSAKTTRSDHSITASQHQGLTTTFQSDQILHYDRTRNKENLPAILLPPDCSARCKKKNTVQLRINMHMGRWPCRPRPPFGLRACVGAGAAVKLQWRK